MIVQQLSESCLRGKRSNVHTKIIFRVNKRHSNLSPNWVFPTGTIHHQNWPKPDPPRSNHCRTSRLALLSSPLNTSNKLIDADANGASVLPGGKSGHTPPHQNWCALTSFPFIEITRLSYRTPSDDPNEKIIWITALGWWVSAILQYFFQWDRHTGEQSRTVIPLFDGSVVLHLYYNGVNLAHLEFLPV